MRRVAQCSTMKSGFAEELGMRNYRLHWAWDSTEYSFSQVNDAWSIRILGVLKCKMIRTYISISIHSYSLLPFSTRITDVDILEHKYKVTGDISSWRCVSTVSDAECRVLTGRRSGYSSTARCYCRDHAVSTTSLRQLRLSHLHMVSTSHVLKRSTAPTTLNLICLLDCPNQSDNQANAIFLASDLLLEVK